MKVVKASEVRQVFSTQKRGVLGYDCPECGTYAWLDENGLVEEHPGVNRYEKCENSGAMFIDDRKPVEPA